MSESGLRGQFIFPLQKKHTHASSIVECPNGDLLACWYHGSGERQANDVLIQGARKKAGDPAWSDPFVLADTPGYPDCNPVLFVDSTQRLRLFWIVVLANRWEHSILKCRTSTDYQGGGAPRWEWQDLILLDPGRRFPRQLAQGFAALGFSEPMWAEYAPKYSQSLIDAAADPTKRQLGWMTRIHPLTLPSGRILLPLYSDGFNLSLIGLSDDAGRRWRASAPIVGLGPTQPTLVRKKDGTVLAYLRDEGLPPNRVLLSQSRDDGLTWTPARDTSLPNPSSSLEVVALQDGRWLMVFNDTEEGRHRLAAALSDDEGRSWKWKRLLEQAAPGRGSFSYPSVIQGRDGIVHATYSYTRSGLETIKHVAFAPDWVVGK